MNGWLILAIAAAIGVIAYVAHRLGWVDLSDKTRSSKRTGVISMGDEVFNPTKYEAQLEIERQSILPAPAPLAGDDDRGIYNGKVSIDLSDRTH